TLGDLPGACELEEEVLAARTRLFPADHPDLLAAKQCLALTKRALGELVAARELVTSLLASVQARTRALALEAPRAAREGAREEIARFSIVLFLCASVDPEHALEGELFATLEGLRLASVASSGMANKMAAHPRIAEGVRGIGEIRARLNDLVAAGPESAE